MLAGADNPGSNQSHPNETGRKPMRRVILFFAAALIVAAPMAVHSETAPDTKQTTKKPSKKKSETLGANQYRSESEAKQSCGADSVVWMNFSSKIYHAAGTRDYGKTKRGAYMCKTDADRSGRPVKGSPKPKSKT
jgi:hypothetical protein